MTDRYILDVDGHAVPEPNLFKWGEWMESRDARRVALDQVTPEVRVSTLFLGLDHSFGEGAPVLWETMIFGGPNNLYQDRYTSHEAALEGHKYAVSIALTERKEE